MSVNTVKDATPVAEAKLALANFNKLTPSLSGFASALIGNNVSVVAGKGTYSDGKTITIRPPMSLATTPEHNRKACDKRDTDTRKMTCPACANREHVVSVFFHEIGHIVFDSFVDYQLYEVSKVIENVLDGSYERTKASKNIVLLKGMKHPLMTVGGVLNKFMPLLINAVEDARVDSNMAKVRPGTAAMLEAEYLDVAINGLVQTDGTVNMFGDLDLNTQMMLHILSIAKGYQAAPDLKEYVLESVKNESVASLIDGIKNNKSPLDSFKSAFALLVACQAIGFFVYDEAHTYLPEPEPEEEHEPEGDGLENEPEEGKDDGESADESDDRSDQSDDSDEAGGTGESGGDDAGTGEDRDADHSDSDDADSDTEPDPTSGGGDTEADVESTEEDREDPEGGADDDAASDGDLDNEGDEPADADSVDGEEADAGEDPTSEESGADGEDEDGSDESEDGSSSGGEGAGDKADTGMDAGGDSDDDSSDEFEDGEPGDGGSGSATPRPSAEEFGDDTASAEEMIEALSGHAEAEGDDEDAKLIEMVVMSAEHFDEVSTVIAGVEFLGSENFPRYMSRFKLPKSEQTVPESIIAPSLLHMRRAFADNALANRQHNRRSGRVNSRVLGRRAWNDDDRLFSKKSMPGKRDYAVLIGIDISGSTMTIGGSHGRIAERSIDVPTIHIELLAAYAQAELCHRLGIKFSVFAHTGEGDMLQIYKIKEWEQLWDDKAKRRLFDAVPLAANLDGHTLEYYRKELDKVRATDKILMYYSDGSMPRENYNEELMILKREIATCKKRGYVLMGVGARTDAPTKHGLDTVRIDSMNDLHKVVKHLGKQIEGL